MRYFLLFFAAFVSAAHLESDELLIVAQTTTQSPHFPSGSPEGASSSVSEHLRWDIATSTRLGKPLRLSMISPPETASDSDLSVITTAALGTPSSDGPNSTPIVSSIVIIEALSICNAGMSCGCTNDAPSGCVSTIPSATMTEISTGVITQTSTSNILETSTSTTVETSTSNIIETSTSSVFETSTSVATETSTSNVIETALSTITETSTSVVTELSTSSAISTLSTITTKTLLTCTTGTSCSCVGNISSNCTSYTTSSIASKASTSNISHPTISAPMTTSYTIVSIPSTISSSREETRPSTLPESTITRTRTRTTTYYTLYPVSESQSSSESESNVYTVHAWHNVTITSTATDTITELMTTTATETGTMTETIIATTTATATATTTACAHSRTSKSDCQSYQTGACDAVIVHGDHNVISTSKCSRPTAMARISSTQLPSIAISQLPVYLSKMRVVPVSSILGNEGPKIGSASTRTELAVPINTLGPVQYSTQNQIAESSTESSSQEESLNNQSSATGGPSLVYDCQAGSDSCHSSRNSGISPELSEIGQPSGGPKAPSKAIPEFSSESRSTTTSEQTSPEEYIRNYHQSLPPVNTPSQTNSGSVPRQLIPTQKEFPKQLIPIQQEVSPSSTQPGFNMLAHRTSSAAVTATTTINPTVQIMTGNADREKIPYLIWIVAMMILL